MDHYDKQSKQFVSEITSCYSVHMNTRRVDLEVHGSGNGNFSIAHQNSLSYLSQKHLTRVAVMSPNRLSLYIRCIYYSAEATTSVKIVIHD